MLSVVHTLRTMEQRTEWRSKRLNLVEAEDEWELLEEGGLALGWGGNALGARALQEGDREPFQELSLASGLLAWLAWDVEIDVRAAVERTTPIDTDEEDDPWYPIQIYAAVAPLLVGDQDAQGTVAAAVTRTARKGTNVASWLATHLALAYRIVQVATAPTTFAKTPMPPRPGELVILGPTVDPRVRVVLDVVPSGASEKITVFDQDAEDHERHFLTTHVGCVAWWERGSARGRVAGA